MGTLKVNQLETDVLIIGGGTTGCWTALTLAENSNLSIVIAEKSNIKRSGCLAGGVNALNAYITKGRTPQYYVDYARKDAHEIVRGDLLLTMSQKLNSVTKKLEDLGLVILKDENGDYVERGTRNIKINGENIKPIIVDATISHKNVKVINQLNITDFLVKDNTIYGAIGFSIEDSSIYVIKSKRVVVATGGASGLYKPNNTGFSKHKMWYPPFNTGAGYSMGLKSGAEMTSFEMRFIALRCKDTISPTGTIAQGVGAKQINAKGYIYEKDYGITTSQRVYGTVSERLNGNAPCYLETKGINIQQDEELLKAYLNMAPSQTLKWLESGKNPSEQNVEIDGTEPYIVGGHTASGYWVDTNRRTTIKNLYAGGDVAGGCPQKYVTGALAEGEIVALDILKNISNEESINVDEFINNEVSNKKHEYERFLSNPQSAGFNTPQLEEAMQKIMDEYAGGITSSYRYNENQLNIAQDRINQIEQLTESLSANDIHELMFIYELKERLTICKVLIEHLKARKETRWHSFAENLDYPNLNDKDYLKYINSKLIDGDIKIIVRDLISEDETYEHKI